VDAGNAPADDHGAAGVHGGAGCRPHDSTADRRADQRTDDERTRARDLDRPRSGTGDGRDAAMTAAAGPFAIAAALLVLAGAPKIVRPRDTVNALRAAGIPAPNVFVRIVAFAELAIGVDALVNGNRASAVFVALSYTAFTVFVVVALRRSTPLASCGCFGRDDTPPSWIHVAVDAGAVVAAVAVAAEPGVGLPAVVRDQPLAGVPFLLLLVCGTFLAYLALSALPRLMVLVRGGAGLRP
jgi:hypothetical protein